MTFIDLVKIDTRVIEFMGLSGLDQYDVPEALRDH